MAEGGLPVRNVAGVPAVLRLLCIIAVLIVPSGDALEAAPDQTLIEAVKGRNLENVHALVNKGADVNAGEADGATPLAWAIHQDDVAIAHLLIRAGANPNAANYYGVTPLSLACTNRNEELVALLLEAGANGNAAPSNGETPLLTAARTGHVGIVKQLLAHGADVTATEVRRQQTALMWAAAEGHRDVVQALIEGGSAVNAQSNSGFTALMFAARQGHVEIARLLITAGADVNHVAKDGTTALMVASASLDVSTEHYQRVGALLLEHGATVAGGQLPYTSLHVAVATRKHDLVKTLMAYGADPNARVGAAKMQDGGPVRLARGATPFWLAAKEVDPQLMRVLVSAGADPTVTPDDGTTALMTAAGVGQVEGPRSGAAFQSPYRSRWDETRALEAVSMLIELGADVNAVNKAQQWTALHGAAHMGADQMVELLVKRGASLETADRNGQTPWSIAIEGARDQLTRIPHKSTADLLAKLGAVTQAKP